MKCIKNMLDEENYEIIIKDDNDSKFRIYINDNELCWETSDEENEFIITNENKDLFLKIHYIFSEIYRIDNLEHRFVQNNKFEWISDSQIPEISNKLIIEKNNNGYIIKFIKNSLSESCQIFFPLIERENQEIIGVFESIFMCYKYYELEPNQKRIRLYKM